MTNRGGKAFPGKVRAFARRIPGVLMCMVMLLAVSCCKKNKEIKGPRERTVLVYMAGDNNLSRFVRNNMEGLRLAYAKDISSRNNLIVFADTPGREPVLIRVHDFKCDTVKVYGELNSGSGDVLARVIKEVTDAYPAKSYGLVLWSHGTGWLPSSAHTYIDASMLRNRGRDRSGSAVNSYTMGNDQIRDPFEDSAPQPETRAFGADSGDNKYSWIDLPELRDALPDGKFFDFILCDACFMASAEVAYALRDKCNWYISSAVEIMGQGFPYLSVVPYFFDSQYRKLAETFYEYYNEMSGDSRTAGIGLFDMSKMDAVASAFKEVVNTATADIQYFDIWSGVQRMDRFQNPVMFDLLDFAKKLKPSESALTDLQNALDECILYKANTPYVVSVIRLNTYCGLNAYIPVARYDGVINPYFKETDWNREVGLYEKSKQSINY